MFMFGNFFVSLPNIIFANNEKILQRIMMSRTGD